MYSKETNCSGHECIRSVSYVHLVSSTLIVLMFILADLIASCFVFFKPGTVAILYFDNLYHEEFISLCIYGLYRFQFSAQTRHQTPSASNLHPPIQPYRDLCICINVKNSKDEGAVAFLFVFNGHCCGWKFEIDIIKSQCIKPASSSGCF